jgi:hypothetical protein
VYLAVGAHVSAISMAVQAPFLASIVEKQAQKNGEPVGAAAVVLGLGILFVWRALLWPIFLLKRGMKLV